MVEVEQPPVGMSDVSSVLSAVADLMYVMLASRDKELNLVIFGIHLEEKYSDTVPTQTKRLNIKIRILTFWPRSRLHPQLSSQHSGWGSQVTKYPSSAQSILWQLGDPFVSAEKHQKTEKLAIRKQVQKWVH